MRLADSISWGPARRANIIVILVLLAGSIISLGLIYQSPNFLVIFLYIAIFYLSTFKFPEVSFAAHFYSWGYIKVILA